MRATNADESSHPKASTTTSPGSTPSCACHGSTLTPAAPPGIVDPQANLLAARSEVGRQSPADAHVAVVVDHAAEQVPLHVGIIGSGTIVSDD
jgi:hypothetical protein